MRLLGMCGFYRRFVPNFAAVTTPLTNLLKKGMKFSWSRDCEKALETVKLILASEPVLVAPDFSGPVTACCGRLRCGSGGGVITDRWVRSRQACCILLKEIESPSKATHHHREGGLGPSSRSSAL